MSMKSLKQAVKKSQNDQFEVGTVIRWLASDKYQYAALKSGNGLWYTTAQAGPTARVAQVLNFDSILRIIERAETTQVMVSDTWIEIN